ncbi:MAG: TAXI family TRAP transporter solute-binding subunit [Deltaproteobacteria bacterium]|nr:TAXI family TRAP transporter solute-binding subunit [Deltaproteobacteria bacterium]
MMKRFASVAMAAVLALFLYQSAGAATYINIATGPTGGVWYPIGSAITKVWGDNIKDMQASAQSTGGTRNNIQLLESGDAEVCMADGLFYDAFNGLRSYEGKPQKFLRGIAPMYPEVFHFLAAKGSGIKTLQDLKGKRVAVGAVGGSVSITAAMLLKTVGLDMEKDIKAEYLGHGDQVSAFSDRRIDASFNVSALGTSSVVEAATLNMVELVPLPDDVVAELCKAVPYFSPFTIPSGVYKGLNEAKTFSSPNIIAVHEKLEDDLVYQMVKTLYEHKADLVAVVQRMEEMKADKVNTISIPLHPGAERYYREIGAIK